MWSASAHFDPFSLIDLMWTHWCVADVNAHRPDVPGRATHTTATCRGQSHTGHRQHEPARRHDPRKVSITMLFGDISELDAAPLPGHVRTAARQLVAGEQFLHERGWDNSQPHLLIFQRDAAGDVTHDAVVLMGPGSVQDRLNGVSPALIQLPPPRPVIGLALISESWMTTDPHVAAEHLAAEGVPLADRPGSLEVRFAFAYLMTGFDVSVIRQRGAAPTLMITRDQQDDTVLVGGAIPAMLRELTHRMNQRSQT